MNSAWSHWTPATIGGHAAELAVLEEHFPNVSMAEPAVVNKRAAVIALDGRRLVAAVSGAGPVAGDGPIVVDASGPSAKVTQGGLRAYHVPIPFALATQTIAAHAP